MQWEAPERQEPPRSTGPRQSPSTPSWLSKPRPPAEYLPGVPAPEAEPQEIGSREPKPAQPPPGPEVDYRPAEDFDAWTADLREAGEAYLAGRNR